MRDLTVLNVSFVMLALTVGCSAPDAEPLGMSQEAASTPFANDKAAYDYFLGKGLTNFQAAAVVGNLDQESGVNPSISQAGGGVGRGIAQWSTGARWDTTKNDNVLAFATEHGQSATSLGLQLDFMWYELTTFPEYGLAALKATTTLNAATQVFEDEYEGCVYANYPECALPARQNYAKNVFAAFGADTGQGGASGGGASSGGAGGASSGAAGSASVAGAGGVSVAGSSSVAGNSSGGAVAGSASSTAGSSAVAGSSSVAGSPSSAGSAGAVNNAFAPKDTNDTSCSFSPTNAARPSVAGSLAALGACCASLLTLRRRKQRRARRNSLAHG